MTRATRFQTREQRLASEEHTLISSHAPRKLMSPCPLSSDVVPTKMELTNPRASHNHLRQTPCHLVSDVVPFDSPCARRCTIREFPLMTKMTCLTRVLLPNALSPLTPLSRTSLPTLLPKPSPPGGMSDSASPVLVYCHIYYTRFRARFYKDDTQSIINDVDKLDAIDMISFITCSSCASRRHLICHSPSIPQ